MAPGEPVHIADLSEIRFRMATILAGAQLSFVMFGAGVVYVAATWGADNRSTIAILFVAMAAGALIALRLPAERIVRSRRRELLFLGWSVFSIALIGGLVAADGGATSPLALLFFVPIVFAALSYPLVSVVAVAAISELTFAVVGGLTGTPDPVQLAFFAACLAMAAVLCAWQAQHHDRRRAELSLISRVDPLTGSLNRRGFEERIKGELDQGLRTGRPLAIVMLDLDNFKEINDTHGHAAGDELLRWTVETIEETVRPMDSIGRLGGDEFALLLPGAGHADGLDASARMREALSQRVDAATGVAAFPAHGVDLETLLGHADRELYAAKRGGRTPDLLTPGRRELSWAAALARAVDLRTAGPDGHSTRVAEYAGGIGEQLGWTPADIALLRMAAMLHDVGKVSVSDQILSKEGPLTEEEYEEMKGHPVTGAELVARVEGLDPILSWIRHSHENFDGSGYPDGLSGDSIPSASRILLVADTFDVLTSKRTYGPTVSEDEALEELRRCAGTQFEPACVEALEAHLGGVHAAA